VVLIGTDQRITSGPAAKRPHSKAEYMTAPERFADSQIPLAPRAPSIHDPNSVLNLAADSTEIRERGPIARWAGFPWTNTDAQNFSLPVTHGLRHNPPVQLRSMSCA
jgi:hypothetical protein